MEKVRVSIVSFHDMTNKKIQNLIKYDIQK